jgi:hypothetical protein
MGPKKINIINNNILRKKNIIAFLLSPCNNARKLNSLLVLSDKYKRTPQTNKIREYKRGAKPEDILPSEKRARFFTPTNPAKANMQRISEKIL